MHQPVARTFIACASAMLLAGKAFAAPVELDPPDMSTGIAASSLINIDVVAGASGAPNGFTIEWMSRAQFDLLGDWPADPADPAIQSAMFLGWPTLNTVDGTTTFLLGPSDVASVQIGDIFDETGVLSDHTNEMLQGTEYLFRVKANGDPGISGGNGSLLPASPYSTTHSCWTKPHDDRHDCVHSQGYWKNHPSDWPVSSVRVGSVIYTKTQLLAIFNQSASGNGLVSLAHQLVAAKLNIAAGAVAPAMITSVVATADALIATKIVPPIGAGYIAPRISSHLTDDLEEFNSNEMDHASCQVVTANRPQTWGQIKAMYR